MWTGTGIAAALVGVAIATAATMSASDEHLVQLHAGQPARLCLDEGDTRLSDPEGGRRRAVLAVHQASAEAGAFAVTADTGEEALIGLFPGGFFSAASPAEVRRSFLPGGPASRCWKVELTGGGTAEVALEVSDPLE